MKQSITSSDALMEPAEAPPDLGDAELGPSAESWRRRGRRFAANRFALVGLVIIVMLVVAAIAAPLITPANYDDTQYVAQTYAFPSSSHFFGVDAVGRDFFSRNIY